MSLYRYSNNPTGAAVTTLAGGGIDASVTTLTLAADVASLPSAPSFDILIDAELIHVGARSGVTFSSLTRGYGGTTAAVHAAGASIYNPLTVDGLLANPGPLTTDGDLAYLASSLRPARLGIGTVGQVLTVAGGVPSWATIALSGGTVTSVALTVPSILSVAGSPITVSGTLAVSLATQVANRVFAGPATGGDVVPAFRALVAADIPSLPYGLLASPLSQFASTTSIQLRTTLSDPTGTGSAVFADSPTLVTPTIASFVNAQHSHQNAAGGGLLTVAAISDLGSAAVAFTNKSGNISQWTNNAGYITSAPAHDVLSATHGDALAASVVRGDLLIGNTTPKWSRLGVGAAASILGSNGTDLSWEIATGTGSPVRATSPTLVTPIVSGLLQQRDGTNSQTFHIYNTYTDGSNWERGILQWFGNVLYVGASNAGTGTFREVAYQAKNISFWTGASAGVAAPRWEINDAGHLKTVGDNVYDIGTGSNNRPRYVFVSQDIYVSGYIHARVGTTSASASMRAPSDGVLTLSNYNLDNFNRLQFGGTTSSFPSIKRNGTGIDIRLADDSAYADLSIAHLTMADAKNIVFNTTTGTKIGTATTQKLGFYNATPIVQGASIADASGGAIIDIEARAAINALISRIEATGLIATV